MGALSSRKQVKANASNLYRYGHFQEITGRTRQSTPSECGAAYRKQLLVKEFFRCQPGPRAGTESHCHVDLIACEIRQRQGRADVHFDVRMTLNELGEARQQPVRGERRHHADGQDVVPVARPNRLNPVRELVDGGPHSFQESASLVRQQHASTAASKEGHSQMFLQALDALAHRAMGDVHLLRGMREIQVPRSRFEEAKRLERGKYARHAEMIPAPTAGGSP